MNEEKFNYVVEKCIKNWGIDSRTEKLSNKVEQWIEYIDEDDKEIYLKLLYKFRYYNKKSENRYAEFVVRRIREIDEKISQSLIVPLLKKEEGISGAHKLIRSIQVIGKINSVVCPMNLIKFEQEYDLNFIKNIIIVDDISGTGKTLIDNLQYMEKTYPNYFENKNVYVTCLVTTKSAQKQINNKIIKANIKYWKYDVIEKAFFEDNIFRKEKCNSIKSKVQKYEELLSDKKRSDIFGYKQSELLVAFSDNTPNNTLLSFWKYGANWNPIFPRTGTGSKPDWAKKRRNSQGNLKKYINS